MREYILTDKEREILENYLKMGTRGNHFYVLVHRLRNHYVHLRDDISLIERVLGVQGIGRHNTLIEQPVYEETS